MAEIDKDGAFSFFSGSDRHFLIASSGCLYMKIDRERRTAAYGQPESFPGEADVSVRLVTGPTSVINLITQRASCTGGIAVERINGHLSPHVNAVALALLDGTASTNDGERLEPLDFLMCSPTTERVHFREAQVAIISVFP